MSFGEIKNSVNSNLSEPLNFTNYMDDISVYGAEGYTMSLENKAIWQDMLAKSLSLFGYTAIHSIVYTRLTDEDVDIFISRNGRLGQCFNAFYQIDDFASGPIDSVLKTLTSDAYNKLERKLQEGICRYVNKKAEGDVGEWLYSLFEIASLKNYHTLDALLADTSYLTSTVIPNTSLWWIVCMMSGAIPILGDPTSPVYLDYIRMVATSSPATLEFIEGVAAQDALSTFFETQEVADIIAGNKEALWGIATSTKGFAAMLNSTVTMKAITSNEAGMNAVAEGFTTATNLQVIVSGMKTHSDALNADVSKITGDLDIIAEVTNMKSVIDGTLTNLSAIVHKVTVFVDNWQNIWSNDNLTKWVLRSRVAIDAIWKMPNYSFIVRQIYNDHYMEATRKEENSAGTINMMGYTFNGHTVIIDYLYHSIYQGVRGYLSSPETQMTISGSINRGLYLFHDFRISMQENKGAVDIKCYDFGLTSDLENS